MSENSEQEDFQSHGAAFDEILFVGFFLAIIIGWFL
jgi:hypothetical protein